MDKHTESLTKVAFVALVAVLLVVATVVVAIPQVLGALEPSPLTYNLAVAPLTPPLPDGVFPGGVVMVTLTRCVTGQNPVSFVSTNALVRSDGYTRSLPMGSRVIDPGCATTVGTLAIPDDLPLGVWYFRADLIVDGRFRQHVVRWRSEPFVVRAR